ncbi:hypothetical protein L2E82_12744 [Cichorium intybus]|uniref:Uncharacterized protein n=1 Tax=Cichorium intybus TaxID=13427 RepID=A0ACB9GI43_CICIN|nr:hypothetical protein L2E82_12744 [Cichorium intybus]
MQKTNLNSSRSTSVITYAFSFTKIVTSIASDFLLKSFLSLDVFLTWRSTANPPTAWVCMMNIGSSSSQQAVDGSNESDLDLDLDLDLDRWIGELYNDDFRDPMLNFGLDELMNIYPSQASQPNSSTTNSGSISGVGSADKSQIGIPQEIMTVSSLSPKSSTSTQQRSAHYMSPIPKFVSNPAAQSSQSPRTTGLSQFPHQNQPVKQVFNHKAVQQSPTHSSMAQPIIMFGHQNNNQRTPSNQIRHYPRPVSTIQTSHLQNQPPLMEQSNASQMQQRHHQMVQPLQTFKQNQNQTQLQFQIPTGTSQILIPEGGRNRVQGLVVGEVQRRPQEHRQENISTVLSADVGFATPNQFPSNETWREYAFRQVAHLKERYLSELLKMHKRAVHLCTQETNIEVIKKYDNAKEFLEKMITFLNIPTVDMIPKNNDRVYNYMNFIVNYLNSFRNKSDGSLQHFDHVNQQIHQPSSSQSQRVVNIEANIMVNMNQQPLHQLPSGQSKGLQMQPNGDHTKSQYMLPPQPSQGIANREANMMNFNQNFPSRRPQGRMPSSLSNGSLQMGTVTPIRIGSFQGTPQQSNMGARNSSVNLSGSSMSLLKAATAANFPSRQFNHQPSRVNQSINSEKGKQPMHSNELTGSKASQVMSPLGTKLSNQFHYPQFSTPLTPIPILQHAVQHSVPSWQVNVNNVLSPQSIARSPFLLGSSCGPSHHEKQNSSSGQSSVSTIESQKPEIPIIAGLSRNQNTIINQVSDMGPPRAPTRSPMNTPEKSEVSQDSENPHLRLIEAVKSLSSKQLGSSMMDIGSVKKDLDGIPDQGEPTKPVGGDIDNITNFLLKYDNMEGELSDGEPANLDHLNIGEETAFLLEYENEQERKAKRKLSITSASPSLPDFSDDDSFDKFFSEDWDIDSTITSPKKKPKIEQCKHEAILEEIKDINDKLLETSLEMMVNPAEDILRGREGILVTCVYRNVCFPDLFRPQEGVSSQMRPEFRIQLLVPVNYPACSPTILNGSHNVLGGPCVQLYEETKSKFKRSIRELPEKMSLGDMAQSWDACARSVFTEFAQQRGAESFSTRYGTWESSSGSS